MSTPGQPIDLASLRPARRALSAERWAVQVQAALGSTHPKVDWTSLGHHLPSFSGDLADISRFSRLHAATARQASASQFLETVLHAAGCAPNSAAATSLAAVHETGHLAITVILKREFPCCVGIALQHSPGVPALGRTMAYHAEDGGPPWTTDLRLVMAFLRGGEAAERLALGRYSGDAGDRRIADEVWRTFQRKTGAKTTPLDEGLWASSLDLAIWALRPNTAQIQAFSRRLTADPLQHGAALRASIAAARFIEPTGLRTAIWTGAKAA